MNYRYVGSSGIQVSAIALGAWLTYGGTVDYQRSERMIHAALANGINFLDLADIYGHGTAEEFVGRAIQDRDRSKLVISSKCYWPMSDDVNDRGLSRKHIFESIHKSLCRLQTDYVDFYFCHRYDENTPLEEVIRAMDDLVRQGKVLYWGTSVWEDAQLERAVERARQLNLYRPQIEQPRYNMFDRHIEPKIMPTAARHGMGIMAWSPMAEGLLTGKYNDGIPEGSRADISPRLDDQLTEENLTKVRQLTELAGDLGISMAQLALAWILRRPEISCAITGATKEKHIVSNVKAVEAQDKLTPRVLERIEQILDNNPVPDTA